MAGTAYVSLEKELDEVIKRFQQIGKKVGKMNVTKELQQASRPLVVHARSNVRIKKDNKPHDRYNKDGEVVATYYPGNLKRSIKFLDHMAGPVTVFVGPEVGRYSKKGTTGNFKDMRVDGWYAHFIHEGYGNNTANPFMTEAYEATKIGVLTNSIKNVSYVIDDIIDKHSIRTRSKSRLASFDIYN